MNEQANTRLVRQAYQSVQAGDFQSFLNALGEDIQWQLPEMENVPFAGTWRGREQVGRFFSTVVQAEDVIEFEPEDFIAQDDKVVALGHFSSRVKSTKRVSASAWAHVWTVKWQSKPFSRIRRHRRGKPSAHRRAERLTGERGSNTELAALRSKRQSEQFGS